MIREESDRSSISALLYQPEKKLTKMAITIAADKGSPTASCFSRAAIFQPGTSMDDIVQFIRTNVKPRGVPTAS